MTTLPDAHRLTFAPNTFFAMFSGRAQVFSDLFNTHLPFGVLCAFTPIFAIAPTLFLLINVRFEKRLVD